MELLRAEALTYQRGPLELVDLSLSLRAGERLGLIGRNGAGKSTLLALLAGELAPQEGRVLRGPGVRLAWLRQDWAPAAGPRVADAAEAALAEVRGLERALHEAEKTMTEDPAALAAYARLTTRFEEAGGYAAEARLAADLAALDFAGAGLEQPVAGLSPGERARLGLALTLAARAEVLLLDEPSAALDLARRRWLAETLRRHPGALVLVSHDRTLLDAVCTHTAELSLGGLTLRRGGYSRFAAQHELLRRSLARRRPKPAPLPSTAKPGRLELTPRAAMGTLLAARHLSKTVNGRVLLDDVQLRLEAGEKVALLGPNGSGKSTLLALLAGEAASDDPRAEVALLPDAQLWHSDQARRGLAEAPLLEQVGRLVSAPRARQLLALVGLPGERWARSPETLSAGERARAALALLIASERNLLLLDEPDAGLDLPMILTLEAALAGSDAAMLLVTHDARLAEAVADQVWSLEAGELVAYRGGVAGYLAGRRRLEADLEPSPAAVPAEAAAADELEALERERLELETLLLDPLRLGARERLRAEARARELVELLMLRYDARYPPPRARYRVLEPGLELLADAHGKAGDLRAWVGGASGLELMLFKRGPVSHLRLVASEGACLLPWARAALLRAGVRLAFYYQEVSAVQTQSPHDLSGSTLRPAGAGWWVLDRRGFEALERHRPTASRKPSRPISRPRRRRRARLPGP